MPGVISVERCRAGGARFEPDGGPDPRYRFWHRRRLVVGVTMTHAAFGRGWPSGTRSSSAISQAQDTSDSRSCMRTAWKSSASTLSTWCRRRSPTDAAGSRRGTRRRCRPHHPPLTWSAWPPAAGRRAALNVPTWPAGSEERQIRLRQRTRTRIPNQGTSAASSTRRPYPTATMPQPGQPPTSPSVPRVRTQPLRLAVNIGDVHPGTSSRASAGRPRQRPIE